MKTIKRKYIAPQTSIVKVCDDLLVGGGVNS